MSTLTEYLADLGISSEPMPRDLWPVFERRWLQAFASNVNRQHGAWVYQGFRWHGFSYELEPSLRGERALKAYASQWPAPFVVFDERLSECVCCVEHAYPDLSPLGDDFYVSHHNLKWTMGFTDEAQFGPFLLRSFRLARRGMLFVDRLGRWARS